jgi:hypothetical protein
MGSLCGKPEVSNQYVETQIKSKEIDQTPNDENKVEIDNVKVFFNQQFLQENKDSLSFESSILETSKHLKGKKKKKVPDIGNFSHDKKILIISAENWFQRLI